MDLLHIELKRANQTWWKVDSAGCFYEALGKEDINEFHNKTCIAGFKCQVQCGEDVETQVCYTNVCMQADGGGVKL
jgi:hypothetical protein